MDTLQQLTTTLALTLGVGWASGLNLYATLFVLSLLANTGDIALPPDLQIVGSPVVLAAAGFMYLVEFFVDKTPGLDTGWDALHTFIRIPAGALLAAGAVGDVNPALELAAAIMGGSLAATSHATKAGARVLVNTSPEPFSNWALSVGEDISVVVGVWAALHNPLLFIVMLVVFIGLAIYLLPKLMRGIRMLIKRILQFFGRLRGTAPDGS